ncbi:unnamed protein product, partial [Discosporangium mesarthrocarpum]
ARAQSFRCNYCFGEGTSQADVFERAGIPGLLRAAFEGYTGTVFAYGQTGADGEGSS